MKSLARAKRRPRVYRQTARAEAVADREEKIVAVFIDFLRRRWIDEFTLNDVAARAGVTVQTVIRKFGGKEGLLAAAMGRLRGEVLARRAVRGGSIENAVGAVVESYEADGDLMLRTLSQEERFPILGSFISEGRSGHRAWVAEAFHAWLEPLSPREARERLDLLVAATDVYLWRLFRRDMGHDRETTIRLMRRVADGVVTTDSKGRSR